MVTHEKSEDLVSWTVVEGLCNSGLLSFTSDAAEFRGQYLGVSGELTGPGCTTEYHAPASTLTMLSQADAQANPSDATWMALDKDTMDSNVFAECGTPQSTWGAVFVASLAACLLLYIVCGVVVGRASGRRGLQAHPHYIAWRTVHGLCLDGVEFTRSQFGMGGATTATYAGAENRQKLLGSGGPSAKEASKSTKSGSKSGRGSKKDHKKKSSKADTKSARRRKSSSLSSQKDGDTGGRVSREPPPAAVAAQAERERQLQEEAQAGVHSSKAKIKVVSLAS